MATASHILFVHEGTSWYVPYAVHQAKSANPGAVVTVLGSEAAPLQNFESPLLHEFTAVYRHFSTNRPRFELFCWLRWFHLLAYLQRTGLREVWHLDSDVLLYSALEDLDSTHPCHATGCSFLVPPQSFESFEWCASGHVSHWTAPALERFCAFALRSFSEPEGLELYQRKWDTHLASGAPGGVCDMTGLYLFWRDEPSRVTNLAEVRRRTTCDLSMNTPRGLDADEFAMAAGCKAVRFIDGAPMLRRRRTGDSVRVHALHFQGAAKRHIPAYYRGARFPGKLRSDVSQKWRLARGAARSLWNDAGVWLPAKRSTCSTNPVY